MPSNLNTFIIAIQNCIRDIDSSELVYDDDGQLLTVAIAYQFYTLAERLDAKLGRIADSLEKLARKATYGENHV